MAWLIVLTCCGAVIALVAIDGFYSIQKRKIDADLRRQEMEAGYPPGTYSRPSKKNKQAYEKNQKEAERRERKQSKKETMFDKFNEKKDEVFHTNEVDAEREELLKGINNLNSRIDNIEIIMASKKEKKNTEV